MATSGTSTTSASFLYAITLQRLRNRYLLLVIIPSMVHGFIRLRLQPGNRWRAVPPQLVGGPAKRVFAQAPLL